MPSDQDLPAVFPVFPLSGAVLFPHTRLPLNIFEPRYLNLIDAVLAGPRFMGMIQPVQSGQETGADDMPIYEIGCLGRLTAFGETDDGRYVITLTGISRFQVIEELEMKDGYRRIKADYNPFQKTDIYQDGEAYDRARFMTSLTAYMKKLGADNSQESFERANDQALITAVASSAPFTPEEKQAILECPGLKEQAELVRSIMEMAVYNDAEDGIGTRH